jgi:predicted aspartyl protease
VGRRIGFVVFLALVVGLIVFVLTLNPTSGRPPAPVAGKPVRIPVEVLKDYDDTFVIVPVTIAGQRFHFALDTGASTTAVNGTVLRAVQAHDTGKEADFVVASGDTQTSHLFRLPDWSVGSVPLQRDAIVSNLARPLDVDGLLGSDQLSRFGRVTVDYDREELVLTPRTDG